MVKLVCKKGNKAESEFLYVSTTGTELDAISRAVAEIHNLRCKIQKLISMVPQLAKYGPMKPENERGLSKEQLDAGDDYKIGDNEDPTGQRVGKAPSAAGIKVLEDTISDAESKLKQSVKKECTLEDMKEVVNTIQGAIMIAYPMGLPKDDHIRLCIESDWSNQPDFLDPKTVELWFAGKHLKRDQKLSKYIGTNEKTKIKVKMQKKGGGAPQREPAVDDETRKKMMSYWHKKQQEAQQLEADSADSYLNSDWANPKAFKNAVNGIGNIRFKA